MSQIFIDRTVGWRILSVRMDLELVLPLCIRAVLKIQAAVKFSGTEVQTFQGVWRTKGASLLGTMSVGPLGDVDVLEEALVQVLDITIDRLHLTVFIPVLTREDLGTIALLTI